MNPPYVFDSLQTYDNRYLGAPVSAGFLSSAWVASPAEVCACGNACEALHHPAMNFTIEQQLERVFSYRWVRGTRRHTSHALRSLLVAAVPGSGPIQQRRFLYGFLSQPKCANRSSSIRITKACSEPAQALVAGLEVTRYT